MALASRGARNMDQGIEAVKDPALVAAARQQAKKVYLMASVTATVATALLFAAPLR